MRLFVTAMTLCLAGSALAQITATIDGTRDLAYGGGQTGNIQTIDTNFGNSTTGLINQANGSELNNGIADWGVNDLFIFLGGNLESNFNKLEIFLDTQAGGQNVLRSDNPNVDFNGLNRMAGLTFDTGFEPDYYITITGDASAYYVNFAELLSAGGGQGAYVGTGSYGSGSLSGGTNPAGILATINNSNVSGVGGGTGAANQAAAAAVATGIELALPLSLIGNPTFANGFKMAAFVNGGGHDFLSNQVLGGLPTGTGNLGDPANVNFNNFAGNQFFAVPEPTSMIALGLGLVGIASRRRKK
jgi:hypothetical protein